MAVADLWLTWLPVPSQVANRKAEENLRSNLLLSRFGHGISARIQGNERTGIGQSRATCPLFRNPGATS